MELTTREKEILFWVAKGHNARGIGKLLGVSQSTVKTHIYNMYSKLGIAEAQDGFLPYVLLARHGWEVMP